jgi:hypothetical protein
MKTVKEQALARLRKWRKENPKKYAYLTLKDNAKRRGKDFSITYEEFLIFCYRYKYIGKKGRTKTGYGVDRFDETKGYTLDNMRLKLNGNNVRKYKSWDMATRSAVTVTMIDSEIKDAI